MPEFLFRAKRYNNRQDEVRAAVIEDGTQPTLGVVVSAQNVDIDNNGKVSMRSGTSQVVDAATHSFYVHPENDTIAYYMVDNTLYKLNDDYSATEVYTMQNSREMSYDLCGDTLVCSNGQDIGFLEGTTFTAFNQTTGQFEELMPAGQFLIYDLYDNCLVVIENNIIHRSKPYNPQVIDRRYSDFPIIGNINMFGIVEDGWWIGADNGVAFAFRDDNDGFVYRDVSNTPVIDGAFYNGFEYMDKNRKRFVAWASKDGLSIGYAGGDVKNLSYPTVALQNGASGKLTYREINGTFQFILNIRTLGDGFSNTLPTLNIETVNV